jgi:adenosylmethionine-8-amino-7-oxononanoate aminotransferase
VLLIADEVMCGMGRTGSLFAIAEEETCPDIITIAKGLGAGYQPIAAVMAREPLVQAILDGTGVLANGHTYMGHPVACAAALAVLQIIESDSLLEEVRTRGAELRAELERRLGQHPHVGDIRGRGLFQAVEFVESRETRAPLPRTRRFAETLKAELQSEGLLAYPSSGTADGIAGDHLLLAPPFIVTSGQIGQIADIVERVVARLLAA